MRHLGHPDMHDFFEYEVTSVFGPLSIYLVPAVFIMYIVLRYLAG
jgi:hypothetical protein